MRIENNIDVSNDEIEEGQEIASDPKADDYDENDDNENNDHAEINAEVSIYGDISNGDNQIMNLPKNQV